MINWNDSSKEDVGPGWRFLLDVLEYHLERCEEEIDVLQVKEKFGGLRFYIAGGFEMQHVVDLVENMSFYICEKCGKPGHLDTSSYWYKTLCTECSATRSLTRQEAFAKLVVEAQEEK